MENFFKGQIKNGARGSISYIQILNYKIYSSVSAVNNSSNVSILTTL